MNINKNIEFFQDEILKWYETNGRHFPWRDHSANKYEKIISEVILQRTNAETAAKFFPRFLAKYSSWKKLGEASEVELQDMLRPIGLYKQRGSRLYELSQVLKKRKGRFPNDRKEIEELPMMGQYLTNAYELFILKRPSPLLDINMARVLERNFGPRKFADIRYDPYLQELAKKVVNHKDSIKINWAILDFGSIICRGKAPLCINCPFNKNCQENKIQTNH